MLSAREFDQPRANRLRVVHVDRVTTLRNSVIELMASKHIFLGERVLAFDAPGFADADLTRQLDHPRIREARDVFPEKGLALGDLTPLFSGFFDTRIGPKQTTTAYQSIAREIGLEPGSILFLSDVGGELDAARQAGFRTTQVLREGVSPNNSGHATARTFGEISV